MSENGNGKGNGKKTLTRRDFFKVTAAAGAGGGLLNLAAGIDKAPAVPGQAAIVPDRIVPTTCAFCSVGCGQLVAVKNIDGIDQVVDVYGDPNHVVNRGALCPKGAATLQFVNGDRRLGVASGQIAADHPGNVMGITGPVYRDADGPWQPYASWDAAITDAATRMKTARDANPPASPAWNSTSVAFLGCSHATNEENWLYRKLVANFGTLNTEHQARI